jgi:hypothetical protein
MNYTGWSELFLPVSRMIVILRDNSYLLHKKQTMIKQYEQTGHATLVKMALSWLSFEVEGEFADRLSLCYSANLKYLTCSFDESIENQ